ncbi:MAG: polysaccharide lyase family 7 protein [Caldilineaceae bacterium]
MKIKEATHKFVMFLLCGMAVAGLLTNFISSARAATNWFIIQTGAENQAGRAQQSAFNSLQYPLDVIHSTGWKLTLPIASPQGAAQEIKVGGEPDLSTYSSEWFHLDATQAGIVFKARTDGATTSGSKNPRSELREMTADGKANASWSSSTGVHNMEVELAVNVLPLGSKPHVVTGQIHDGGDDVTVFRVEGSLTDRNIASIWITDGNTTHGHLLTDTYHLGDRYRVGFRVSGGQIHYTFNGQPVAYVQNKNFSGAYFKAGSYNQAGGNCTQLADGQCDYAEVTIYALQVCHDGICTGNAPGAISQPTATPIDPTVAPTTEPTSQPTVAPTTTPAPLPPTAASNAVIYLSSTSGGNIGNVRFKDEDIVVYALATGQWQLYFDGSDVELADTDVDAFAFLPDGSLLFSFITATNVPGVGKIDDSDIVQFIPTALGPNTAGSFQLYFDGSDVGLTKKGEDIDALAVLKDGRFIVSTTGHYKVGDLSGDSLDFLAFTPHKLGADTEGDWSLYFKGAEAGLKKGSENISGVWIDETTPDNPILYLSARRGGSVGSQLQGDANDIFTCNLATGAVCALQRFWDGNDHNFGSETIDSLAMNSSLVAAEIVWAADASEDDGGAENNVEPTAEIAAHDEVLTSYQIFLPVITK